MKSSLWSMVPEMKWLYRLCRTYVDRFNGENNINIHTNGEELLMRLRLPQARTVFDVGANVGDWAALALEINPQLLLHCFEPVESTFASLAARKFPPQVTRNRFACGAAPGSATIYQFGAVSEMSSLYARSGLEYVGVAPARAGEVVSIDSIDAYCMRLGVAEIDYLKIDVEGHELQVLQGANRMLTAGKVKAIQFEYGGVYIDSRTLLKDVWEYIVQANQRYCFYKLHSGGPRHESGYSQALENFQYQNWVAVLE